MKNFYLQSPLFLISNIFMIIVVSLILKLELFVS